MSVSLRRATAADVDFITEVYADEDVRPFLAASGRYDREQVREEIERSAADPGAAGVMLIESDGAPAGVSMWRRVNERSRIAHLGGLAVHPAFRGGRISDEAARQLQHWLVFELGFHRLELEVYGFNEPALRTFDLAGFKREGVRRRAYDRHGDWQDGVRFGLLSDE